MLWFNFVRPNLNVRITGEWAIQMLETQLQQYKPVILKVLQRHPGLTTPEKAEATLLEYFEHMFAAIGEDCLCIDFFDVYQHINEAATLRVR